MSAFTLKSDPLDTLNCKLVVAMLQIDEEGKWKT